TLPHRRGRTQSPLPRDQQPRATLEPPDEGLVPGPAALFHPLRGASAPLTQPWTGAALTQLTGHSLSALRVGRRSAHRHATTAERAALRLAEHRPGRARRSEPPPPRHRGLPDPRHAEHRRPGGTELRLPERADLPALRTGGRAAPLRTRVHDDGRLL